MKTILLTGFTAAHAGSTKRRNPTVGRVPGALRDAIALTGATVDMRPVALGENLKQYDGVVVFVMSLLSLTTSHALGALWALATRPDAWIVVDDWQVGTMVNQFRTAASRLDYYLTSPKVLSAAKRRGVALLRSNTKERRAVFGEVTKLGESWDHHRVAAPVFPWGDVRGLGIPAKRLTGFDPSPLTLDQLATPRAWPGPQRLRRWVSASLFDHTRWIDAQEFAWPVERYGGGEGATYLLEPEVLARYAATWGMLGHPYKHCCGWWRPRYLHAAQTRSVIFADRAELEPIGQDAWQPRAKIEGLTVKRLAELAAYQAHEIHASIWTTDQLVRFARTLTRRQS